MSLHATIVRSDLSCYFSLVATRISTGVFAWTIRAEEAISRIQPDSHIHIQILRIEPIIKKTWAYKTEHVNTRFNGICTVRFSGPI